MNFDKIFEAFSKFGNTKSDGTTINLSQADKWMKQAGVINKTLTTTDTAIQFNKFKTKAMDKSTFEQYLQLLCKEKNLNLDDVKKKLIDGGMPGLNNATETVHVGGVDRLTDTTKYTGTHKERFDEHGKGKGIAGRESRTENDGYVAGYKNKDTYDKTHNT